MNGRQFLAVAAGAVAAAAGGVALPEDRVSAQGSTSAKSFIHRVQFGAWINDMRNDVLPRDNWPSKRLDQHTEDDIVACLALGQRSGYNQLDVWGLFETYAYPPD